MSSRIGVRRRLVARPTHQVDNTLSPEASDGDLTTGRTTTHQVDNTLSPEASDGDLTTGRTTTHQIDNTLSPEASGNLRISGHTTTHQVYDRQKLTALLTNYVAGSEAKVIAIMPPTGWSPEAMQEVGTYASATLDEYEKLRTVLVVLIEKP